MYWGAMQMPGGSPPIRTVLVSGGPSSASDVRVLRAPAALAADRAVRKSRRD
jgi:hypothetical protein